MTTNLNLLTRDELIELVEGYRAAAMAFERALDSRMHKLRETEHLLKLYGERIDYLHDKLAEVRG